MLNTSDLFAAAYQSGSHVLGRQRALPPTVLAGWSLQEEAWEIADLMCGGSVLDVWVAPLHRLQGRAERLAITQRDQIRDRIGRIHVGNGPP